MHLAQQAGAERQLVEALQPPPHRGDVVDDLLHIGIGSLAGGVGFEDLGHARLRSLDPRRGERLSQEVGADEEIGVREEATDAGEPAQRPLGLAEQAHGRGGQVQGPRYRRREVGHVAVAPRGAARLAERGRCVRLKLHRVNHHTRL